MKITKEEAMNIIKTHQVYDIQVEDFRTMVFCAPDEQDKWNDLIRMKFTFYSNDNYVRWEADYYM